MTERRIAPLGPEALAFAAEARLIGDLARGHAPIEEFFEIYQRVVNGQRKPGDVVALARRLIDAFGGDCASLLWRLGSPDKDSVMGWQITLQERSHYLAGSKERLSFYAKRLEKRRGEAEIFNAIQALVDEGKPLNKALQQVAGHGVAVGKGADTLKKIWQSKSREIKAGNPRLRPAGVFYPYAAEVIAPGKAAKKTGRPKKG